MAEQDLSYDGSIPERFFEDEEVSLIGRTGNKIMGLLQRIDLDKMGITVNGKFYSIQDVKDLVLYDGRHESNGAVYMEVIK